MPSTEYRTLYTSVRPPRVAVLVFSDDPEWEHTCLRVIEFLTMLWGGKCSLIVPTDGKTILPIFWQLLEAFDPDYLYFYRKTGLDTKLSRPSEFADWLQHELASWMAHDPGEDRAAAEQRCDEALCRVQYTDPGISPELQEELKRRLSPFTNAQYAVGPGGITAAGTPQWRPSPTFCLTAITLQELPQ